MGISSVGNYQVPQVQQSQSFFKTNCNKGKVIGGIAGLATGLAVSTPKINDYITVVDRVKNLDFSQKKSLITALQTKNPKSFSSVKNFLKMAQINTIASTAINAVVATAVGVGVGFLVDKTVDFFNNRKAKKEQNISQ